MKPAAANCAATRSARFIAVLTNRFNLIQEFYKWQKPPFVLQ